MIILSVSSWHYGETLCVYLGYIYDRDKGQCDDPTAPIKSELRRVELPLWPPRITQIAVAPAGFAIVSSSWDNTVRVWGL